MEQNKNKALSQALVAAGYITPTQITKALEYQCRLPPGQYLPLSQILLDFEYVTELQMREVMGDSFGQLSDPIAQVLIEQGLVSDTQLEQALQILESFPRSHVGEVLIDLGFATEIDVKRAISNYQLEQSSRLKSLVPSAPGHQEEDKKTSTPTEEPPVKSEPEAHIPRSTGPLTDLGNALSVPLARKEQQTSEELHAQTVHLPLGRKLIARGLIADYELEDAIAYQQRLPKLMHQPLGEILVSQGYVSQEQMDEILAESPPPQKSRVGEILIKAGLIEEQQLSYALSLQFRPEHANKRLGTLLVELGYARREAIEAALTQHFGRENKPPAPQEDPVPTNPTPVEEATAAPVPSTPTPASSGHKPLGQILIEKGYISEAQLQQALQKQVTHTSEEYIPLGDILLLEGWVTEIQLQEALAQQPVFKHVPIGQILISEDVIEEWQLAHALCQQFDTETGQHKNLGAILVSLGYAQQDVIESAVIRYFRKQRENAQDDHS